MEIWTDGSCNNNPKHSNHGIGGWAFVVIKDNKVVFEDLGYDYKVTSQKMEMTAVIKAMQYCLKNYKEEVITIVSDSAYIINCFKEKWYVRWMQMDWDDVKNSDYWKEMLGLKKQLKIRFKKVKGHSGVEFNELADLLAGEARKYAIEIKQHS